MISVYANLNNRTNSLAGMKILQNLISFSLLILLLFISFTIKAQINNGTNDITTRIKEQRQILFEQEDFYLQFTAGIRIELGRKANSSLRGFLSLSAQEPLVNERFKLIGAMMVELEIFRGGLGASSFSNDLGRFNFELRNHFQLTAGVIRPDSVSFGAPAFSTVDYNKSAALNPLDQSFSLSTVFINGINHKRNQRIGSFTAQFNGIKVYYYNDATPFNSIFLSDGNDRYWTGGGSIAYYFKEPQFGMNKIEVRYDNYTGFQPNLYQVAGLLKIDNLPYKSKTEQLRNKARFSWNIGFNNNYEIGWNTYQPKYFDIQYLIHLWISKSPFHTRPSERNTTFSLNRKFG